MKIIDSVDEGCAVPWYMGHAYWDYSRLKHVVAVVPLHWLFQFWKWIDCIWCKVRFRRSWIDRYQRPAIHVVYVAKEVDRFFRQEPWVGKGATAEKLRMLLSDLENVLRDFDNPNEPTNSD